MTETWQQRLIRKHADELAAWWDEQVEQDTDDDGGRMKRIWIYRPQLWWYGWRTLLPVQRGSDEHNRSTIAVGWTITGRVIIAYGSPRPYLERDDFDEDE